MSLVVGPTLSDKEHNNNIIIFRDKFIYASAFFYKI